MHELTQDLNKSERISFPVTFDLKVIMDATIPDSVNEANIEALLGGLQIRNRHTRHRLSSSGRYMSYTYSVTIESYQVLSNLYSDLKTLPGLKFAV